MTGSSNPRDDVDAAIPAAAVIVAGGRGTRMGGQDKPALRLGGRTLLQIALTAVGDGPTIVVGARTGLPAGVRSVVEDPVGGGPAAAVTAGLAALPELPPHALIAVLAADLPGIDRGTLARLRTAAAHSPGGAVLVDDTGRRQYLTGVWRLGALTSAAALRPDWTGRPLRELLAPIVVREVAGSPAETADVDTVADWDKWRDHPP